jgi:hypothetical protein
MDGVGFLVAIYNTVVCVTGRMEGYKGGSLEGVFM